MHRFVTGMLVVWREGNPSIGSSFGAGPFTIKETRQVPMGPCIGPDTYCDLGHHERCPVRTRESVGHHQWVKLEEFPDKQFSGFWFQPAPSNISPVMDPEVVLKVLYHHHRSSALIVQFLTGVEFKTPPPLPTQEEKIQVHDLVEGLIEQHYEALDYAFQVVRGEKLEDCF